MRDKITARPISIQRQIGGPGGPIETFSNRPMNVNGVQVRPTWAWSDQYRKLVRQEMAKVRIDPWEQAHAYKRWYKLTHSVEYAA